MTASFPSSLPTALTLLTAVNNLSTNLNGSISDVDATITVDDTTGFPTSGDITIESEVITYTGKSATTFTGCSRGQDGTSAAAHSDGLAVNQYQNARYHNLLSEEIIALATHIDNFQDTLFSNRTIVKNLRIICDSDTVISIAADSVLVKDSNNNLFDATSVSISIDITGSGAGGLDTGAEASDTWYYIWLIYNSSTTTVDALISTSASSPTLSSGYTYKALIGAVRNDGSSNFVRFFQKDNIVDYKSGQTAVTDTTNSGSNVTDLDLSSFIPLSISRNIFVGFSGSATYSATGIRTLSAALGPAGPTYGVGAFSSYFIDNAVHQESGTPTVRSSSALVPVGDSGLIDYYIAATAANRTSYSFSIVVTGFKIDTII